MGFVGCTGLGAGIAATRSLRECTLRNDGVCVGIACARVCVQGRLIFVEFKSNGRVFLPGSHYRVLYLTVQHGADIAQPTAHRR